jgi:hypothetical protein
MKLAFFLIDAALQVHAELLAHPKITQMSLSEVVSNIICIWYLLAGIYIVFHILHIFSSLYLNHATYLLEARPLLSFSILSFTQLKSVQCRGSISPCVLHTIPDSNVRSFITPIVMCSPIFTAEAA